MRVPDRGDLIYLRFSPQMGHEQAGRRPALVLSPKIFNQPSHFAIVCPITSKSKGYPFELPVPEGLPVYGTVLVDQVKSLDWKSRGARVIGKAPDEFVLECLGYLNRILS